MHPASSPVSSIKSMQMASRARGFTLVELMVTISVLAVILMIAIPSFSSTINGNRLVAAANEVSVLLQTARVEALRRSQAVIVCPVIDPNGSSTAINVCTTNGATGMKAFTLNGVVLGRYSSPPRVEARFSSQFGNRLVFRPDGFARSSTSPSKFVNAIISLCIPTQSPSENIRQVSIESGSRITTNRLNGDGKCVAPTSNSL